MTGSRGFSLPVGGETTAGAQAKADAAQAAAATDATIKVAAHEADTTNVHGIIDTSVLETTTGAQTKATAAQTAATTAAATDATTKASAAQAAAIAASAQRASNLSDLASASTARTNLGLGGAATLAVGTTAGTVAAGDDARIVAAASNMLTVGEETIARDFAQSAGLATSTQSLRLTYFTARKAETTTQVRVYCTGTAAAATPTLVRLCLYLVDGSDGGTLVASTANDTTLFATANTTYTRSWSTPYTKVAGQRYAFGLLVVTAGATPTFGGGAPGGTSTSGTEMAIAPRLAATMSGQTDLPGTFVAGSLTITQQRFYAAILP